MNLNALSSGQALAISAVTGGPSVLYAAASDDWLPVVSGIAIGVVAFLWAVRRSNNDMRLDAILKRLDLAEKQNDEYLAELTEAKKRISKLQVELDEIKQAAESLRKRVDRAVAAGFTDG